MSGGGYTVGPTLAPDERPWPILWEQSPTLDDCDHTWESVLLAADGLYRARIDEVIRCSVCHTPRCGYVHDDDPCMLRRHHFTCHATLTELAGV
jgi:hypothetical protein